MTNSRLPRELVARRLDVVTVVSNSCPRYFGFLVGNHAYAACFFIASHTENMAHDVGHPELLYFPITGNLMICSSCI